jgi:hypothetical protein
VSVNLINGILPVDELVAISIDLPSRTVVMPAPPTVKRLVVADTDVLVVELTLVEVTLLATTEDAATEVIVALTVLIEVPLTLLAVIPEALSPETVAFVKFRDVPEAVGATMLPTEIPLAVVLPLKVTLSSVS